MEYINNWKWVDLDVVESTNDEAKKYAVGTMVSAKRQLRGRGRRGRSWIGLRGNLFVSFNMQFEPRILSRSVIRIGLAVFEAVKYFAEFAEIAASASPLRNDNFFPAEVKLKWPNDVLLNGKKVCGILVENLADPPRPSLKREGGIQSWIVGIGVNIAAAPAITGLVYPATSLRAEGIVIDRIAFLHKLVEKLDEVMASDFDEVKKEWLFNVKGLDEVIKVRDEGFEIEGKFIGIDNDGILMIECEGTVKKILAGDII